MYRHSATEAFLSYVLRINKMQGKLCTFSANRNDKIPIRQAAWYSKALPTFSDALALVREELWQHRYFQLSQKRLDIRKLQLDLLNYLSNTVFYTP
jgi:hypothetical protein